MKPKPIKPESMKSESIKPRAMKQRAVLLTVGLLVSFTVLAAPAAWYKWKSKLNGEVWCTQTSPGDGWVQASGPYKDAHCKIVGSPGKQ